MRAIVVEKLAQASAKSLALCLVFASIFATGGCSNTSSQVAPEKIKTVLGEEAIAPYPEDLTSDFRRTKDGWQADGPVTDKDLQRLLAKSKRVGAIRLNQSDISPSGLMSLKDHGVTTIEIQTSDITAAMVKAISQLDGLEVLALKDPSANDHVVAELTGPRSLKKLFFKNATITSKGIDSIHKNFPELRCFFFIECSGVDDLAVKKIISFKKLDGLGLIGTSLTNQGLVQLIEKMPLRYLKCERQHVGEKFVESLSGTAITDLDLSRNQLSERSVLALAKLKQLKSLTLLNCGTVASARKAWLQAVLPGCAVFTDVDRNEHPAVGIFDK